MATTREGNGGMPIAFDSKRLRVRFDVAAVKEFWSGSYPSPVDDLTDEQIAAAARAALESDIVVLAFADALSIALDDERMRGEYERLHQS